MEKLSIYQALVKAGCQLDNHYSDLYVRRTPLALGILAQYSEYHKTAETFLSAIDGKFWIDIPFAYEPYWTSRFKSG